MGAVYAAEETALGRRVAIKIIHAVTSEPKARERFAREARILAAVEHPHVVRVYSFGEVAAQPYLVMEYVEGETLGQSIERLGVLPVREALQILRDVVDALEAAWEHEVIHRDIKPSNILLDRRDRVRVADFGLAKPVRSADASLTTKGYVVGTADYISPEQAQDKPLDFRSDFYSLGVTLFHMLSGGPPFTGSPLAVMARQLYDPMPSLRSIRSDIPPEVDRLVASMTAKEPSARPASHAALRASVDGLLASLSLPNARSAPASAPRTQRSPRLHLYAAAALALAGVWLAIREVPAVDRTAPVAADSRFVVAVAPFYGPDADSAKEGRIMAALIERAIAKKLGRAQVRVIGIEETKSPIHDGDAARKLGTSLAANAVVWGEAFALARVTEIQPHVTVIEAPREDEAERSARPLAAKGSEELEALANAGGSAVRLGSDLDGQLELRRTSAAEFGDVVAFLAAMHLLDHERKPSAALALLEQIPQSAATLRYRVQALLDGDHPDEARALLEEAVAHDPAHAPSLALLGDLNMVTGSVTRALDAYRRADALGQPYTTSRGIFHDGRLYVKETYQPHDNPEEVETLYVLAMDPASGRIIERHRLSGPPQIFRREGDAVVIVCQTSRDGRSEVVLRSGHVKPSSWPPPETAVRLASTRVAWQLPANFIQGLHGTRLFGEPAGRFVLGDERIAGVPATLADLERALRAAVQHDATQPWHLFFLMLTLRHQGRSEEADAVLEEMLRRDYPAVPYYDFTWMMSMLERLDGDATARETSGRLYAKALRQRKRIAQLVTVAGPMERLASTNFLRHAALSRDPERGYTALLRARELTGFDGHGEDLVAAAWARYFEQRGDIPRTDHERAVVRAAHENPFNSLAAAAKLDYAIAAAAVIAAASAALLLEILCCAHARARRTAAGQPGVISRALSAWPRGVASVVVALVAAAVGYGAAHLSSLPLRYAGAVAVVTVLLLNVMRSFAAFVTRRERFALFAAYVLVFVSTLILLDRWASASVIWRMPTGLADGIGHPQLIAELESLMQNRGGGDPALRYAAALANHYAGDIASAEHLYHSLPDGWPNAGKNLAALGQGRIPEVPLSAAEAYAALGGSRRQRWRDMAPRAERDVMLTSMPAVLATVLVGPIALLAFLFNRPRAASGVALSRAARLASLVVPGVYDVRRGAVWRGFALLLLTAAAIPMPLMLSVYSGGMPAVGGITTGWGATLNNYYPLPSMAENPTSDLRWVILQAYPYATLCAVLSVTALVAAVVMHLSTVRRILRERDLF